MNKREIAELFKFIRSIYPNFEVDQYKINTWAEILKGQNPATVMKNAERHVFESKYPPTIAELRGAKRREDKPVLAQFWSIEEYE